MNLRTTALRTALLAGALLFGTAACGPAALSPTASTGGADESQASPLTSSAAPAPGGQTALAVLATLPVKGRAPQTGYDRDQFGQAWADVDRNGCDTRNDVLRRDLTGEVYKPGTADCVVLSGSLADPYTATTISFERGDGTSVDIDHVVALGDAWQTGAFAWDVSKRTALANDPLNLLAVDYSANRQKGDGDAATWLPSNRGYRCSYVARQLAVKAAYGLWVTPAEHDAINAVLAGCPHEPLPTAGTPAPAPESVPASAAAPAPGAPYENCTAARAAGAAPLHRGEPGYSPAMDGDGDGTACE
ncbi:Excalibur calcium-binding domain-containing protein [Modestobacter sp. DSM 44400]|uniref:GmrSD restriction endonuclease domain-containing protein n=1 Tax=Modestobacter sp. DSM 44400 TaxID=1550230 RepID=UPI00089B51C7|nr:DUF1524 domain-containing protein [Modestobacter sp. DSM 44400]SDY22616.1 Excalibur calcium-binding domain-containing protein [Modestobacter sp. DSM 44400]